MSLERHFRWFRARLRDPRLNQPLVRGAVTGKIAIQTTCQFRQAWVIGVQIADDQRAS